MPARIFNASVGKKCKLCDETFVEGEKTVLMSIRPADAEEAAKRDAGRPYTSEAVEVHAQHVADWVTDSA